MEIKHRRENCIDNQVESRDEPGGWGIGTGSAQQKKINKNDLNHRTNYLSLVLVCTSFLLIL